MRKLSSLMCSGHDLAVDDDRSLVNVNSGAVYAGKHAGTIASPETGRSGGALLLEDLSAPGRSTFSLLRAPAANVCSFLPFLYDRLIRRDVSIRQYDRIEESRG